jgi:hypothetical protein
MNKENVIEQLTEIIKDTKSENDPSDAKEIAEQIIEQVREELQK